MFWNFLGFEVLYKVRGVVGGGFCSVLVSKIEKLTN